MTLCSIQGFFSGFRSRGGGGQMLSTKIKGGSGASTNYVIGCAKTSKGGGGGGKSTP